MLRKALLFALIVALAFVFGFVSYHNSPGEAVALVRRFGYWQILAVVVAFAYCLLNSLKEDARRAWHGRRMNGAAVILILAATLFLHVQEPHEFKIVADEVVLQDTAMQMHFDRQVSATVRGYDLAGNYTPLQILVDKRPLFFPFLLSLVHDFTGYRVANAFWLNAGVSLVLITLFFLLGQRLGGFAAGAASVLLAVSVPLIHQNATGSGFELLNMVMILSTLWLGMRYVERPDEVSRVGAFVFSGILLAQTRYESALFIAPVGLIILYEWWRRHRIDLTWPILVAPLMLVIVPLHFNVFKVSDAAWQMGDRPNAGSPFGFGFFYDNIGHAMNFFLCTDGSQGNSLLVAVVGTLAVGFFVLTLYREYREMFFRYPAQAVLCIFIISLVVHTLLMLCYFWGQFDDPIIRRLSLPSHLLLILAILFVWSRLVLSASRWRWLVGISALYILSFTVPSVAMHRYSQENFAARTNVWVADFIDRLGDDSALAIDTNASLQWFIHRKSSISFDVLTKRLDAYFFHFKNHSFRHFFVVQRMGSDFEHFARFPSLDDDVGDGFHLELVTEKSFSPVYAVRISRVVGIDEEKIKAWAEKRNNAFKLTPEMKTAIKKGDDEAITRWFQNLP